MCFLGWRGPTGRAMSSLEKTAPSESEGSCWTCGFAAWFALWTRFPLCLLCPLLLWLLLLGDGWAACLDDGWCARGARGEAVTCVVDMEQRIGCMGCVS